MAADFREQVRYPFKLGELLYAKYLALLHDPPWKLLRITGALRGEEVCEESVYNVTADIVSKIDFDSSKHEEDATCLARTLTVKGLRGTSAITPFRRCSGCGPSINFSKKSSEGADIAASSFDRIASGLAESHYVMLCSRSVRGLIGCYYYYKDGEKRYSIPGYVVAGLMNVFRPILYARGRGVGVFREKGLEFVEKFVDNLSCRLHRAAACSSDPVDSLRRALHVFEAVYEPLWHEASGGTAWGPADSRVPTHSIFDHLYASAAAMNLAGAKYSVSGWRVVVLGFLVYAGWRGLGEWVRSGRRLADVWAASWLATALTWRALGGLIWCLGGDIVLVPGIRWNQFYLALLRSRLGSYIFDETVGDVAHRFYLWEGFPYYGYEPSHMTLVLPLLDGVDAACQGEKLLGELNVENKSELKHKLRDYLSKKAKRLEKVIRDAMVGAWNETIDAVAEALDEVFSSSVADALKNVLELVRDIPPLEPLVAVVPVAVLYNEGSYRVRIVIGDYMVSIRACNSNDIVEGLTVFLKRFGLSVEEAERIASMLRKAVSPFSSRSRCSDERLKYFSDLLSKLVYALGFYELSRRVGEAKQRVPGLGWARLAAERFGEAVDAWRLVSLRVCGRGPRRCGGSDWRNCSVCRRGVAVFIVPGRDEPDGVSLEYRRFAQRLCRRDDVERYGEECWRLWRPVFRPGEALCPYCLVKRLMGLPEVFKSVAKKLVGYEPSREVRFPSTDDLAGLATKIALVDASTFLALALSGGSGAGCSGGARELADMLGLDDEACNSIVDALARLGGAGGGGGGVCGVVRELVEAASSVGLRGSKARELQEVLRRIVREGELCRPGSGGAAGFDEELRERLLGFIGAHWWRPRLLWEHVRRVRSIVVGLSGDSLAVVASALLLAAAEFQLVLESDSARDALVGLAGLLRRAIGELRTGRRTLGAMVEALSRPRIYYGLLRFDVDRAGLLALGVSRRLEDGGVVRAEEYLEEIARRGWVEFCRHARGSSGDDFRRRCAVRFLSDYLRGTWQVLGDPVLGLHSVSGASVLVSPSYHYALAESLAYTLLRLGRVVERLGGIPVYLAGDEGLLAMPAWLPRELIPYASRSYREEAARALREAGVEAEPEYLLDSPAGLASVMLPRILWGSSPTAPGFHPVKPWGRGESLYRIPALVGATVSATLRLSHYRDHLYAEIEAADYVLESAKRRGGGVLAVSMGRVSPAEPGTAPAALLELVLRSKDSLEGLVKSAAAAAAAAVLLAGVVDRGLASSQLLRSHTMFFRGGAEAARTVFSLDRAAARAAIDVMAERYTQAGRGATVVSQVLRLVYDSYGWEGVEAVMLAASSLLLAASRSHVVRRAG